MWKDDATAADILLAARDIRRFTAGLSRDDFFKNRVVQFAVVNRITVMGEAAKRLSQEFRLNHPSIEWKELAGTRDRCVHGYDSVDPDIVWQVVTVDAPAVENYLISVLNPPPEPET